MIIWDLFNTNTEPKPSNAAHTTSITPLDPPLLFMSYRSTARFSYCWPPFSSKQSI